MQQLPEPAPALPAHSTRELVHTLNNQLTVVLAQTECVQESEDPEELRRALRAIQLAALAMADCVRAIARATPRSIAGSLQSSDSPAA